jgi:c-di-GMP-binding flagellar brake protein YcgR
MVASSVSPCCPHCGSAFIQVTQPKALHEYLLPLLQRAPCQCQVCGRRCTSAQAGLAAVRAVQDRRHFHRLVTHILARATDAQGRERSGVASNLSIAGCQLQLPTRVADKATLRVVLYPTDMDHPIVIERAVVRVSAAPGVGVRFVQIAPGARLRLQQVVQQLLHEQWASAS